MRVLRVSIGVGAVLFFALACGGGGTATQAPATGAAATQAGAGEAPPTCGAPVTEATVTIENNTYTPASVTIAPSQVVTWTNADSVAHTVTFDDGPDCSQVAGGSSIAANFSAAGSYAYHCTIHPSMKGTVVVQ